MNTKETRTVSVRLTGDVYGQLEEHIKKVNTSVRGSKATVNSMVAHAVKFFLDNEAKKKEK